MFTRDKVKATIEEIEKCRMYADKTTYILNNDIFKKID